MKELRSYSEKVAMTELLDKESAERAMWQEKYTTYYVRRQSRESTRLNMIGFPESSSRKLKTYETQADKCVKLRQN